jgi:hypothetical protein
MHMTDGLIDKELPGFFKDADEASLRGQRQTILWSRIRLYGVVMAAFGGALSWKLGSFDFWGGVALLGFAAALAAELFLAIQQPERDWYSGRALAESAKTLAWRYAVGGDPFFDHMSAREARTIMQERFAEIAAEGKDRITLGSDEPDVTARMAELRKLPFEKRRAAYLDGRIQNQRKWYAEKARKYRKHALAWRIVLIIGETSAMVLAGGRAFGAWNIDISGVLAAAVAGGAAWLGLRQYSSLASAYSVTAAELGLSAVLVCLPGVFPFLWTRV